ncbi:IS3 family transposase [Cloacibacillus evryensis]
MTDFFKCFLDEKCQRPDEYIRYYNNDRIQIKLKKAPMQYRSLFIE